MSALSLILCLQKKKRKKAASSADSLSYQSRIHSMEEKDFSV